MDDRVRILCLGDVVGRPGRKVLGDTLLPLRRSLGLDFVIANGENASGGIGLTASGMRELFAAGVDCITSGNHIWRHKEIFPFLHNEPRLLRPYNYGERAPGKGFTVLETAAGFRIAVLNLIGRVFMEPVDCPFAAADEALALLAGQSPDCIIVDFHAEASSEKRAMAHHLDGRSGAVLGTHTHVQTADAFVSASGTASLTDLGMCGVEEASVIGMSTQKILKRFTTCLPQPFIPEKGNATLNGALIEVDKKTGKALCILPLRGNGPQILALVEQ
ncbi:YmdB family metallophosphoesterase [Desulfovibrio sp. OttesenSCG-928-G15]|nr:YmdB family metallophosphoesterase [Desulfovibrio sp. OttesenSCG-928-G15]